MRPDPRSPVPAAAGVFGFADSAMGKVRGPAGSLVIVLLAKNPSFQRNGPFRRFVARACEQKGSGVTVVPLVDAPEGGKCHPSAGVK